MGLSRGSETAAELGVRVPPARPDPTCDDGLGVANELSELKPARHSCLTRPAPASARCAATAMSPLDLRSTDALAVVMALLASYALRYPGHLLSAREAVVIALAPLVWIGVFCTLQPVRPPARVGPRGAPPCHRGLRSGDRPAGDGQLLVQVVVLPGLGRSHLGAGPRAGAAVATAVAGVPVAAADGRPAGPADPGRRHLGRGQPARRDPPGRGLGVPAARACTGLRP